MKHRSVFILPLLSTRISKNFYVKNMDFWGVGGESKSVGASGGKAEGERGENFKPPRCWGMIPQATLRT